MTYKESERIKVERIREAIFMDPGDGIFRKIKRRFVLSEPEKNLWYRIREDALSYFRENKIVWWGESSKNPTGHLLSSQIACINHLFFLRNDKTATLKILKGIDENFIEPCNDFEGGYIGFEVVSNRSYLGEVPVGQKPTRGANCTSVDAMMSGILKNGKKIQVLIEWKYTENYPKSLLASGKSGLTRQSRYNHLIKDVNSPIMCKVGIENMYYEPIYQLMRQTLLAWQMIKHKKVELQADDWLHLDVIPENNLKLRYKVPAPELEHKSLEKAWKSQLREPNKYQVISPQKLLSPILFDSKYRIMLSYLNARYW
jgi:hypothetical protein